MGSFWIVETCNEAKTLVGLPSGIIYVSDYEQAIADNNTAQLAIWDAQLAPYNIVYLTERPETCPIDPEIEMS